MTLEWLAPERPRARPHLRTYLFTDGSIVAERVEAEHVGRRPRAAPQHVAVTDRSASAACREAALVNHLLRDLAPVSDAAWAEIETEAKRALENFLAARRLVDFTGPHGWAYSASTLGGVDRRQEGAGRRSRGCAAAGATGRRAAGTVHVGARRARRDRPRAQVARPRARSSTPRGRSPRPRTAPCSTATPPASIERHRRGVAPRGGRARRRASGSTRSGSRWRSRRCATPASRVPTAIALGPRCYSGILETTEDGGYPVLERLRLILDGPVVYAPAVDGAVVLSMRGDDFELSCGQDVSIGFDRARRTDVELYLEESFAFHAHSPEAAVALEISGLIL